MADASASHCDDLDATLDRLPVLDPDIMARLRALRAYQEPDEQDIVTELIDMFLDDIPKRMTALRDAVANAEAEAVERLAHSMKGSCENLGVKRMGAYCAALELQANQGRLENAATLFDRIETQFHLVHSQMEDERQAD